jgi:hypothetical protein
VAAALPSFTAPTLTIIYMLMQVLTEVDPPPSLLNPPPNWKEAKVAPGTFFTFYAYETFQDGHDWITGEVTGRELYWKRASFFLPAQDFEMLRLQPDNTWKVLQIIKGPMEYIAMDAEDGDALVLRLRAV